MLGHGVTDRAETGRELSQMDSQVAQTSSRVTPTNQISATDPDPQYFDVAETDSAGSFGNHVDITSNTLTVVSNTQFQGLQGEGEGGENTRPTWDDDNLDENLALGDIWSLADDSSGYDDATEDLIGYRDIFEPGTANSVWGSAKLIDKCGPANHEASANMIEALHGKIALDWASEHIPFPTNSHEGEPERQDAAQSDLHQEQLTWKRRFFVDFYMALGNPGKPIAQTDITCMTRNKFTMSMGNWSNPVPTQEQKHLPFGVIGRTFKFGYTRSTNTQWYLLARPKTHGLSTDTGPVKVRQDGVGPTAMTKGRAIVIQDVIIKTMKGTRLLEATFVEDGNDMQSFHLNTKRGTCNLSFEQLGTFMRSFFLNWEAEQVTWSTDEFWLQSELSFYTFAIGGNTEVRPESVDNLMRDFEMELDCANLEIFSYDLAVNLELSGRVPSDHDAAGHRTHHYSLCGDKAAVMREFPKKSEKSEVHCYPMAWSPSAVSIQTKHCPQFVNTGLVEPLVVSLLQQNAGTIDRPRPIFTPKTQMYNVLSHNVRKQPRDFLLQQGILTGAYCLNVGSAKMPEVTKRTHFKLLSLASKLRPIRQLVDSVNQAIAQKHHGYRFELGMSVRLGSLLERNRTFKYIGIHIVAQQMKFWSAKEREATFTTLLRRFEPEVSLTPANSTAFSGLCLTILS